MEKASRVHAEEYGLNPEIVINAPGRIHLVGEHSWFFGDKTLSLAVNLPVYVAVSRREDTALLFSFHQLKEHKKSNVASLKYRKEDRWANFFKAMVYGYLSEGNTLCGLNVSVYSDVLPSAGFGITTGMTVAFTIAVNRLFQFNYDEEKLLKIMEKGYKNFLNQPFYRSDVYTSLFAKKDNCLLVDHSTGNYEYIPFNFEGTSLILTDGKVPRITLWDEVTLNTEKNKRLLDSLKTKRNGQVVYQESLSEINEVLQELPEDERRRLLCIIKESQYVNDAIVALKKNSLVNFVRAINKSHEILRDLFLISCPEIDWLTKRVQEFDAGSPNNASSCARITGKGFGRCTFTLLKNENVEIYMQKLIEYERIFGFHAVAYEVQTSDGALLTN